MMLIYMHRNIYKKIYKFIKKLFYKKTDRGEIPCNFSRFSCATLNILHFAIEIC